MASSYRRAHEVTLTIVYEGPPLAGKTTSLRYLHATTPPHERTRLVRDATETECRVSFECVLPDLAVRLRLRTIRGPYFYESARQRLLEGVDGLVFVADAEPVRQELHLDWLGRISTDLEAQGKALERMPLVFQYSKRDLDDAVPVEEMERTLNRWKRPAFASVATTGRGVREALRACVAQVLEREGVGERDEKASR